MIQQKHGAWRDWWPAQNWSMERYAFPRNGSRPVSEVNTADVLEILTAIWYAKGGDGRHRPVAGTATTSSGPTPPKRT